MRREAKRLDTRVIGVDAVGRGILLPALASVVELARVGDSVLDTLKVLDDLERKAHGCMPANVAMHEPDTWVVGLESEDQVAASAVDWVEWHERNVTARWVVGVEDNRAVVGSLALSQDEEVVTVKMDRVRQWDWRLNDDIDPFAKIWHFNGKVARVGWDGAVVVDGLQSWVIPLSSEGRAIQSPLEEVRGVWTLTNNNGLLNLSILSASSEWHPWYKLVIWLVNALLGVVVGRRGWHAREASVVDNTLDVLSVGKTGASLLVIRAHPVAAWGLIGLDDDIVTLTNIDVEDVGLVRYDWYKVVRDHSELVAINVELEGRLYRGVDHTEQVLLAWDELLTKDEALTSLVGSTVGAEDVLTVDETGVEDTWATRRESLSSVVHRVHSCVRPILEDDHTSIDIVVRRVRTMNDHWAEHTLVGLKSEVRVVP